MALRKPGKPNTVEPAEIVEKILLHKNEIVNNQTVCSSKHEVWKRIGDDLKLAPSTIHSYVCNNRFDLKNQLLGEQETSRNQNRQKVLNSSNES